jgi:hypothetical protein
MPLIGASSAAATLLKSESERRSHVVFRRIAALAGLTALLAGACGGGSGAPPQQAPSSPRSTAYHPLIDASTFSATVDNPWFPLKPGTIFVYVGVKDGEASRDIYEVTHDSKVIDGVPCVVVHDRLYIGGRLEEETLDYYTQDTQGNVWYFGEDTKELDAKGKVTSTEGTWHAGVDGAQPGIFMPAQPGVGESHRQEYYKGHAEDQFQVLELSSSVTVPYASFDNALLTKEWTALEPDVLDHKYWVRGIGEVAELSVKGPTERALLVSVTAG